MFSRQRKKKPPDPRLSPFDFPLDRFLPVDLASYLLSSWIRLQPCPFPCSIFDHDFSAVPLSSPVHFLSQPVVGFQRRLCWFRIHRLASMIQMELCIQRSSAGRVRYCCGVSLASIMASIVQTRGFRSVIVERCWQAWHIRSIRFESYGLVFFRQTQGMCRRALTFSSQPPPWRPYSQQYLDQHVNMLCLYFWMFDQPLLGGWTVLCILFFHESACLLAEQMIYNFVSPWSWTFSYLLLSLSRACKYAQEHVYLYTFCCWHLDPVLRLRDEVKAECLIVYEDNFSETTSSCLMHCLFPSYCCYILGPHQIPSIHEKMTELWTTLEFLVDVKPAPKAVVSVSLEVYYSGLYWLFQGMCSWQYYVMQYYVIFCTQGPPGQLNMYWSFLLERLGYSLLMYCLIMTILAWNVPRTKNNSWLKKTLPCFCGQQVFAPVIVFRNTGRTAQLRHTTESLSSLMNPDPLMLIRHCKMWRYPVNGRARLQCIHFNTVFFSSRRFSPLATCCNHCFITDSEQHLRVLGPCLMALALHLRMLGTVYCGPYYSYCLFLARVAIVVIPPLRLHLFCYYVSYGMSCSTVHFSI